MEYTIPVKITFDRKRLQIEPVKKVLLFMRFDLQNGESYSFLSIKDGTTDILTRTWHRNKEMNLVSTPKANPATGGSTFLNMDGIVDLMGQQRTVLCASETTVYDDLGVSPAVEDIPVKEEKNFLDDPLGFLGGKISDGLDAAGKWIDENRFLVNAIVGTLAVVACVAVVVVSCGAAAPALAGVAPVLATGLAAATPAITATLVTGTIVVGGYCYFNAMQQDFQSGVARSPLEMAWSVFKGSVTGAAIGLVISLIPVAAPTLAIPTTASIIKGLGIGTASGVATVSYGEQLIHSGIKD